jgi:hypothetical protein
VELPKRQKPHGYRADHQLVSRIPTPY